MSEVVGRWRPAGYATFNLNSEIQPQTPLYIKFIILLHGYEVEISDFKGHLWRERLEDSSLQDRLKSEASGLEIDSQDLLKLLDQMTQNIVDSTSEISSDLSNLVLRAFVKVGFIKLKWTFKASLANNSDYNEMIRRDFLMPFFGNLREDKTIRNEIDVAELNSFYKNIVPNLKIEEIDSQTTTKPTEEFESQSNETLTMTPPTAILDSMQTPIKISEEDLEEGKRRQLEEVLQANKSKKKKKLI